MMTTATKITILRVFLIPAYMVFMYLSGGVSNVWMWLGLAVFILASITDFVDGYIARNYNQVTDLGKFLDPLADKLLTVAAMAMFCQWGSFPAWALMIVLTREFAVSGLRMVAGPKGKVIAAGKSGTLYAHLRKIWNVSRGLERRPQGRKDHDGACRAPKAVGFLPPHSSVWS